MGEKSSRSTSPGSKASCAWTTVGVVHRASISIHGSSTCDSMTTPGYRTWLAPAGERLTIDTSVPGRSEGQASSVGVSIAQPVDVVSVFVIVDQELLDDDDVA